MSITSGQAPMFLLICLVGVALGQLGCGRTALTVDQVIERNTEAIGGRAAIEAIKSIEVALHISDPGF
jgi:hypothetical protein